MNKRPVLYVNRITNLSDARYCAGMNVDLLGFVADPGHPDYVTPQLFREITGWISGPRKVIELSNIDDVEKIIQEYSPDLIHIMSKTLPSASPSFPMIVEGNAVSNLSDPNIEFVTVRNASETPGSAPSLLYYTSGSITELMRSTKVSGFILSGTPEQKPGLKDYDHLSGILEELDS